VWGFEFTSKAAETLELIQTQMAYWVESFQTRADLEQINCRKMLAAYASPKASRPAPVVAPGEPEEVATTAKKSRSRNALEANWREDRTALVSTEISP
jgi:hypothetical protein